MEAHLDPTQPAQVNKITTSCEIYSGPHDTQYCMEDPEQPFVEYASSRIDEVGGLVSNFMASQDSRLSKFEANFKQQQSEMTNKIDTVLKAITDRIAGTLPSDTVKNPKLSTYLVLSARSHPTEDPQCSTQTHDSINAITIHTEQQSASYDNEENENKKEEDNPKNIHVNPPTPPDPSVTFITEKVLKFNSFFKSLGLVPSSSSVELVYTKEEDGAVMFIEIVPKDENSHKEDPMQEIKKWSILKYSRLGVNSHITSTSCVGQSPQYFYETPSLWKDAPRTSRYLTTLGMRMENTNRGVSNFTGRIKGMHVFVGNITYIVDFMIIEVISSIIDPRLSQVVLEKPFVEISSMTHDPPEGVVRNKEDKRREVEYVMSKILGFYKECLELGPEYLTGMDDEEEVTLYLMRRSLEVLRKFHWTILG
ncbi:hypothetical protein Tco_0675477 [Tanacetum coccineum]